MKTLSSFYIFLFSFFLSLLVRAFSNVGFLVHFYRAFNDLIADPQFAALGLVLLATLARIYGLIRDGNGKKQEDDEEVLRRSLAFEGTAPVASTARERTLGEVEVNEDVVEDERMVDVGEIVPRDLSHVENKLLKEHGDDRADVNSSGYDDGVDSMRVEVRATSPRQRKTEEDRRQEAAEGEEAVRGERQKSLKESSRPRKRKKNAIDELFKGLV